MSETIILKTCSKCKQTKQLTGFYKHQSTKDGHRPDCKSCFMKQCKKYRQTKQGKAMRQKETARYYKTEKGKATRKRYQQSEKGKVTYKHSRIRHPECFKARRAVMRAITTGRLPRPNTRLCHYCPKPAQQYHHHKGYAPEHQLDVVPVCRKCHQNIPKKSVLSIKTTNSVSSSGKRSACIIARGSTF